jgi:hypothetical protein
LAVALAEKSIIILIEQTLNDQPSKNYRQELGDYASMKSSTKKILVLGIIVLFIISIVAGILAGHL